MKWLQVFQEYTYDLTPHRRGGPRSTATSNSQVETTWLTFQTEVVKKRLMKEGTPVEALKQLYTNQPEKYGDLL